MIYSGRGFLGYDYHKLNGPAKSSIFLISRLSKKRFLYKHTAVLREIQALYLRRFHLTTNFCL